MRRQGKNICGPRVREARLLRRLTQEELADRLSQVARAAGLEWESSRDNVQAIESQNIRVTDTILFLLAVSLRVDARWLINLPEGRPPRRRPSRTRRPTD